MTHVLYRVILEFHLNFDVGLVDVLGWFCVVRVFLFFFIFMILIFFFLFLGVWMELKSRNVSRISWGHIQFCILYSLLI